MGKLNYSKALAVISLLAFIGVFLYTLKVNFVQQDDSSGNAKIDQVNRSIVGKWIWESSTYLFRSDNTLTMTSKSSKGKNIIKEGEYIVVESGVFLKFFYSRQGDSRGSRNLPVKMGMYLSMPDDFALVDNQEDYGVVWRKEGSSSKREDNKK